MEAVEKLSYALALVSKFEISIKLKTTLFNQAVVNQAVFNQAVYNH